MKALIIWLTAIAIFGCSNSSSQSRDVRVAIDKFHTAYNAGDYEAVYASGSAGFRCSIDLESLAARLAEAKLIFENFESSEFLSSEPSSALTNSLSEAVLHSTYEQNVVTERFHFVREKDKYWLNRLTLMQSNRGSVQSEDGTTLTMDESGFAVPAVSLDCD